MVWSANVLTSSTASSAVLAVATISTVPSSMLGVTVSRLTSWSTGPVWPSVSATCCGTSPLEGPQRDDGSGLSAASVPPDEADWRSSMCVASYTVDGRDGDSTNTTTIDGRHERGGHLPMALQDLQVVKGLHESLPGTGARPESFVLVDHTGRRPGQRHHQVRGIVVEVLDDESLELVVVVASWSRRCGWR